MVSSENQLPHAENHPRPYYAGLDGLRGVAILLIIGYHIFHFIPVFRYGWLGVDLFFVLSGFLITDILLKTRRQRGYLKNFYVRRILRIFPIYYLTLIVFILLLPAFAEVPYDADYYTKHQAAFWLYLVNWNLIVNYPEQSNFLTHLWSLSIEEQFYLVWPWLVILFRSSKKMMIILISMAALLVLCRSGVYWLYSGEKDIESFFFFSRIDGLVVGSALAVYLKTHAVISRKVMTAILLTIILLNVLYFLFIKYITWIEYFSSVGFTSIACVFAFIVYFVIRQDRAGKSFILQHPALRYLGKISYGFYIYHWPIYVLFFGGVSRFLENFLPSNPLLLQVCAAVAVTLLAALLSIISYLLIEKRFLQLKSNFN